MSEQAHPIGVPVLLANALKRFATERDLPDAISPKDLHEQYGGPYPFDMGWHWRYNRETIDRACSLLGLRIVRFDRPKGSAFKMIWVHHA